ncbi:MULTISPECIES: 30S ribosomal protein S4 [Thermodesulfovibrio]|jgi:small subunit ribosomal protein S4|uniref:Small ribosomal subunit protein uS4 n=2 Tax=Thermodesulfovibrio yellowstonii TaxID=28262 RepID=RS4_THEYD|nr:MULTISPECIES: 30S ribosomal protein S4 [Thermodesulfovibrio]B5YG23.1 RecName: Full=Small ribosomal subunit protein uS4; AltName: Full=30S ribosomal protein S4 [Thermodesulfovibrio yellowstonii DSM 11347]ACI21092.1 ribosomal protein S4 [Thermodesulfovibrio yellowstonii DSM 11347]MDI6865947.1 30S ribosomal protein S4 [Thermodesulfovibrio yellowstonii]GLI53188.1 30S ribosomal protein S4 [Thermodesulfovibrio islandicus]
MARYTGSLCRLCRRESMKMFLKGTRCYTEKCAFERRKYPPGQHGHNRGKLSDYGLQLREKQKVKRIYGVMERQFKNYFEKATKMKGVTGENLLKLLERRLDNVIYRMGFAMNRRQARQLVRHGYFTVNGKKVDIPSYLVRPGDIIEIVQSGKELEIIKESLALAEQRGFPVWLEVNAEEMKGKFVRLPEREEMQLPVQEQLIVEFYSK